MLVWILTCQRTCECWKNRFNILFISIVSLEWILILNKVYEWVEPHFLDLPGCLQYELPSIERLKIRIKNSTNLFYFEGFLSNVHTAWCWMIKNDYFVQFLKLFCSPAWIFQCWVNFQHRLEAMPHFLNLYSLFKEWIL